MNIFTALILAMIEGATEFLPISSTGHLILASNILKIPQTEFLKTYEICIQFGAIMAVVVLYWRRLISNPELIKKVLIAFIPTGIISFGLYKIVKSIFLESVPIVITSLFFGGLVLILFEKVFAKKLQTENKNEVDSKQAFIIGVFQTLALIPGVSRSAATILTGMVLGVNKKEAVEFSFLLAVPTMFAATGYDLLKTGFSFSQSEYILLLTGIIGAFIAALASIKLFVRYVEHHSLASFGIYRIIIALLALVLIK
jgi:undecaprenyl-diphosphatase